VEDREVGSLTGTKLATPVLLESSVRRSAGEGAQGLLDREPLVGEPPARRLAVEIGASNGGEQPEPRVAELDREVAPEGEVYSVVEKAMPGVRTGDPGVTDALLGPGHVARAVSGLHRRDDPELGEAR